MKRTRLLTVEDATPAGEQITKPCSDCPWSRAALNGWLGGNTAEEWVSMAHGETLIECHVHPDVQCAGAAIYRANVAKRPRHPAVLLLTPDRERVFARSTEFLAHHAAKPKPSSTSYPDCSRCDGTGDDPEGGTCDCCGGTGNEAS